MTLSNQKMSVREKRLRNEFEALTELINNSAGALKLISKKGNPPYEYIIQYKCRGVKDLQGNQPNFSQEHRVRITLGQNYPTEAPEAKFLTPIFHPNVYSNSRVCLGNYQALQETLVELVLRIGKMIQYSPDVTNLNSPAHSGAKNWASQNQRRFPLDNQTFKPQIRWKNLS